MSSRERFDPNAWVGGNYRVGVRPVLVDTKCKHTGYDIKMPFRLTYGELDLLTAAREQGEPEIEVERFCPFCIQTHAFRLPIPEVPKDEKESVSLHHVATPSIIEKPVRSEWMTNPQPERFTLGNLLTTSVGNLHRSYWKAEEQSRLADRTQLEEAIRTLPYIINRYRSMEDKRSAASAKILLAQARVGLGDCQRVDELLTEAVRDLDPGRDDDMFERADKVRDAIIGEGAEATLAEGAK